jgi:hypothetical protein
VADVGGAEAHAGFNYGVTPGKMGVRAISFAQATGGPFSGATSATLEIWNILI